MSNKLANVNWMYCSNIPHTPSFLKCERCWMWNFGAIHPVGTTQGHHPDFEYVISWDTIKEN